MTPGSASQAHHHLIAGTALAYLRRQPSGSETAVTQLAGTYFNADPGFDTKEARKTCFNHSMIPNIKEHGNRKRTQQGPKRLFDAAGVYKDRFAW